MQSQKWQNDLYSFPRQTIQYYSNPSLCPSHYAEEAKVEWYYEDIQNLLELTSTKNVLFIIGDWISKVGSQEIPGVTGKFGLEVQNEAEQGLTEFFQENILVIANTLFQHHKRWLYTWTSPGGQYWNQIDYIFCSWRWRNSIQSAKTRPGGDYGSDCELLIAKFRLKLNTARPFRSEKAMAPHSSTLAWKIPWMEGCSPWVKSRTRLSDFTFTFHFHALEQEMATHSSVLAWRIPGTGAPGGLPSMGSHRVGHDWSDLAAAVAAHSGMT